MCYSASVSFTTVAFLLPASALAMRIARPLPRWWMMWALVPLLFGIQQFSEGWVWLSLNAGNEQAASGFSLAFHFFSHFLWVWWIPLASGLVETGSLRQRLFFGTGILGFVISTLVYGGLLLHPEWMHVYISGHSIIYDFFMPVNIEFNQPVTPLMLYSLIILTPLLLSSHTAIRIFGVLLVLAMALASWIHNAAFVSVWCFFAALISIYIVVLLQQLAATQGHSQPATGS